MASNRWMIGDYINEITIKRFSELISRQVKGFVEAKKPSTGSHLLFFHPVSGKLSTDGYYEYQTPGKLLNRNIEFKRRMWVQGRIDFLFPLKYTWYDCIEEVRFVRCLNGDHFVGLDRTIRDKNDKCYVKEFRMLIYTDKIVSEDNFRIGKDFANTHLITFNDIDVMQYSSISSNPHRIHWDRDYVRQVEGYKDIIVQGPFIVQTALNFIETKYKTSVISIKYKNVSHIYANSCVQICDNGIDKDGNITLVIRNPKCTDQIFFEALLLVKS